MSSCPRSRSSSTTRIAANVGFAKPGTSIPDIEAMVRRLELDDWVDTLRDGLLTRVGERGENLSAGERQLVALLRAGIADPDVLVLDEATSSVDALTEVRISRALSRLAEGRTTIAIAHRLSTAARADRVLVLDEGVLVEDGTHEELVAAGGVYSRLYDAWMVATTVHDGARDLTQRSSPNGGGPVTSTTSQAHLGSAAEYVEVGGDPERDRRAGTDIVDLDHDLPAEGRQRTDAHDDAIVARPITEVLDRSLDHGGSIAGHTAVQFDDRPWLVDEVIDGVGDRACGHDAEHDEYQPGQPGDHTGEGEAARVTALPQHDRSEDDPEHRAHRADHEHERHPRRS